MYHKEKKKSEILTPNQVAKIIYDTRFDLRDRESVQGLVQVTRDIKIRGA